MQPVNTNQSNFLDSSLGVPQESAKIADLTKAEIAGFGKLPPETEMSDLFKRAFPRAKKIDPSKAEIAGFGKLPPETEMSDLFFDNYSHNSSRKEFNY